MPEFIASRIKMPLAGTGAEATQALAGLVAELSQAYASRRDMGLASKFLADRFDLPSFWLYGAGTHSAALLATFGREWAGRLIGIIDRAPGDRGEFHGLPIYDLAHAAASDKPILVAHPFFETDMGRDLRAAGVDPARIRYLYSDADYIELSRLSLPIIETRAPAVILGSTRFVTVTDGELARVLDPATTPYLAFDLFEQTEPRPPFTIMPMDKSIDAVVAALNALRPRLVYLRTKMETDFLAYLVRQILPDCILVHELWDFSVVFEDATLIDWLKFPKNFIEASRLAECWSVRESDLVISKWGGGEWAKLFQDGVTTELFFGGIGEAASTPKSTGGPMPRVLYAGLLPKPEDLAAMPYDYNFLERLESLSQTKAASVTILNSAHDGPAADPVYREYETRFVRSSVTYGRRVGYDELMVVAAEHDFGWLALDQLDQREEWDMAKPLIVPMRFTGYVQAGLPIIINQPWALCVELVERFSAGIVLEGHGGAEASLALSSSDLSVLRLGVKALQEYMRANNELILDQVSELFRLG